MGFAGTPASHSLTGSVPVERAGINVIDVDRWEPSERRVYVRLQNFTPYDPAKLTVHKTTMEGLWARFAAAM